MRRWARALMVLTLGLAACGQAHSSPGPRDGAPHDTLYLSADSGLELISSTSGETVATVPGGVTSPDFTVHVSTQSRDGATRVSRMEASGEEMDAWTIPGDVVARVVSPLGTHIALTERSPEGATTYAPAPRDRTRIVVAEAGGKPAEFDLRGNFEPEAFSTDGKQLFLLEYIPALAPTKYRVRRLILNKDRVVPIGRLKSAAPNQMQGTGRAQVYSPWGDKLYTLYTQQSSAGHEGGAFSGNHAFVHMLDLEGLWTHCIDLPHTFGHGEATASALALSPRGTHLFVVDWSSGIVAVAPSDKLRVTRTAEVAFGSPDDRTFARATRARLFVAGGAEIVVLDTADLNVVDRWTMPGEITGLALSEDEKILYASTAEGVSIVDTSGGEVVEEIEASGSLGITHAAPAAP